MHNGALLRVLTSSWIPLTVMNWAQNRPRSLFYEVLNCYFMNLFTGFLLQVPGDLTGRDARTSRGRWRISWCCWRAPGTGGAAACSPSPRTSRGTRPGPRTTSSSSSTSPRSRGRRQKYNAVLKSRCLFTNLSAAVFLVGLRVSGGHNKMYFVLFALFNLILHTVDFSYWDDTF